MADILLAAELENEMDAMAEGGDGDEDVYADDGDEEEVGEEGQVMDRSHLVGKPKRKRELKAGLLRFLIKKKNFPNHKTSPNDQLKIFPGSCCSTNQSATPSVDFTCDLNTFSICDQNTFN